METQIHAACKFLGLMAEILHCAIILVKTNETWLFPELEGCDKGGDKRPEWHLCITGTWTVGWLHIDQFVFH